VIPVPSCNSPFFNQTREFDPFILNSYQICGIFDNYNIIIYRWVKCAHGGPTQSGYMTPLEIYFIVRIVRRVRTLPRPHIFRSIFCDLLQRLLLQIYDIQSLVLHVV
jgi:hypothetical protein